MNLSLFLGLLVIQCYATGIAKNVDLSPDQENSDLLNVKFPDQKELEKWMKLFFEPQELVKAIAVYYKIPVQKLIDLLGDAFVSCNTPLITPAVTSFRIIERVFAPNSCSLGLACQIGGSMNIFKHSMLKIKPSLYDGSNYIKAMADGIGGADCQSIYSMTSCELKLALPTRTLTKGQNGTLVSSPPK